MPTKKRPDTHDDPLNSNFRTRREARQAAEAAEPPTAPGEPTETLISSTRMRNLTMDAPPMIRRSASLKVGDETVEV